jgi:hypothetical protein
MGKDGWSTHYSHLDVECDVSAVEARRSRKVHQSHALCNCHSSFSLAFSPKNFKPYTVLYVADKNFKVLPNFFYTNSLIIEPG